MEANEIYLPKTIGNWSRSDSPQRIDSQNIFEYMNGAGELYLGYRFHHLEAYDYINDDQNNILVELYFMETADDAFGLLSLDWGGEPIFFSGTPNNKATSPLNSSPLNSSPLNSSPLNSSIRALYGAGLLRIWSDTLYARVMAPRETPIAKQTVLTLGQTIAANRKNPPEPDVLKSLALQVGSVWKLRPDRLSFFRSYLVLNSIYYISHENILDLDLTTEAVTAPYEHFSRRDKGRCRFLLVKYQTQERALKALRQFHDAYLPEHKKKFTADSAAKNPGLFKLEDGWLAYRLINRYIAIVFECPDEESARTIIRKNETHLDK